MFQVGGYRNMYGAADWLAEENLSNNTGSGNVSANNNTGASNKPVASGSANVNEGGDVKVGEPVSLVEPSVELIGLQTELGDANFVALGGDDDKIKVIFASLGPTGAAAEVDQIKDAGKLIDLYALADLALTTQELSPEKKAVLEQVQTSVKAKLGTLLAKAPTKCPSDDKNVASSAWNCFSKMTGNEIAIISLVGVVALLLVAWLISVIFFRKCRRQ